MYAGPGDGYRGEFMAWDVAKQEKVWSIKENFPVWSGTVVTAGDVAFYGTMDRWFNAVDAKTGEVLWSFRAPSGFIGQPVTYLGDDGRQYVAILSGIGGWSGGRDGRARPARAQRRPRLRRCDPGPARLHLGRQHAAGVRAAEEGNGQCLGAVASRARSR
jgi:hypothetical protein